MKESNILAGNATIKQHKKDILLNTKEQYTKESNTLVGYAAYNCLTREILQDTIGLYIEANKHW